MASSSRTRSKASAALLGERRDSWEWDSLKLCIKRVLVREGDIDLYSEFICMFLQHESQQRKIIECWCVFQKISLNLLIYLYHLELKHMQKLMSLNVVLASVHRG